MKLVANAVVFLLIASVSHAFTNVNISTNSNGIVKVNDRETQLHLSSRSISAPGSVNPKEGTDLPALRRNPPRKVCLMVEPTPFTHVSGYSNRFKEMLKFMREAGDEVDILTVDAHTEPKDLPSTSFGYKIRHTKGFTFPLYNHISLSLDLPEMKGAQMLKNSKPDLIHVTSPGFMVFAAVVYSRLMKIPLLMSYHTDMAKYGKYYLGKFIPGIDKLAWLFVRIGHSFADLTLVTSPQLQAQLKHNGVPRVDVWRKGIDTDRFHPKFKSATWRNKMTNGNPDDFLMVYVGRLGTEKRLKDIKAVMERVPNARLCLVGSSPQEDELQEFFKDTNTVFTGSLSGDDLSSAFASGDAFIMPSDSETLGFVVLESMASGVPVVGARAGGIVDLIDHERTGFLVEPGDTDGYVNSLIKLQGTTFRQDMGDKARVETERWGWEAATSVLRNIQYEKAMNNFNNREY